MKKITIGLMALSFATALIIITTSFRNNKKKEIYKPVIEGEWWNITNQPDLGKYTGEKQQPVDFGVWKAKDGTWQLWSCVRGTKIGGKSRLFYRWEAKSLTDTAWIPKGIAMEADSTLGETYGGLQAPYVFEEHGKFYMFYGDWNGICLATSDDGKSFTRVINESKTARLFTGPLYNTRDPMVLKVSDTYYCYYSAHNEKDNKTNEPQGAIYCRTSRDMKTWGEPVVVSRGGTAFKQTQWYAGDIECPFVVRIKNKYVMFRNQKYGPDYLNTQYCSENPLDFGDNNDDFMIGQLPVAAPEIIKEGNQYYIVSLKPNLDGMKIAKLKFVRETK
jgi:hypothetical protein